MTASSDNAPEARTPPGRRARRWLAALGSLVVVAAVLVAAGIAWLGSQSALDYAVAELRGRAGDRLTIEGVSGALTSTISATRIVYRTPDFTVVAEDVVVTWSPTALWSNRLEVSGLGAQRVGIELTSTSAVTGLPTSLALPIEVAIAHAGVARLEIRNGPAERAFEGIAFSYAGGPTRHEITDLVLAADVGRLTGSLALAANPPFGTRGAFTFLGAGPLARATANVNAGGSLDAIDVKAALRFGEATAEGSATLAPLAAQPVRNFRFDAHDVDLSRLDRTWPRTALAATIEAAARDDGVLAGTITARNGEAGSLAASRVPVASLSARFSLPGRAVELAELDADLGAAGRVTGGGSVALDAPHASDWRLVLSAIDLARIHPKLATTRLAGSLSASLGDAGQRYEGELTQRGMGLGFAATVVDATVTVKRFRATAGGGELAGNGTYDGSGRQRFTVQAKAARLDPSRFGAFPSASLDGKVAVDGTLVPAWSADVAVTFAPTARLAGSALSGTARGSLSADALRDARIDVKLAAATLTAQGSFGRPGDRLDFTLDAPRLADFAPLAGDRAPAGLAGRLRAAGHVAGSLPAPGLAVEAHGEGVNIGALAFDTLDVRAELAAGTAVLAERRLTFDATAARLATPTGTYATASVRIDGSLARHTAALKLAGQDLDVEAMLDGGATGIGSAAGTAGDPSWTGILTAFENRGPYAARLTGPARLQFTARRAQLDDARLSIADGEFRVDTLAWDDGRIATRGTFGGVPLATMARLAGTTLPLRSTVVVGGEWRVAANPRLNGTLAIRRERGDLFAGSRGVLGAGEVAFGATAARIDARFVDDALDAQASLDASQLGTLRGTLALGRAPEAPPGRLAAAAPLTARLHAEIASLAPLQPLLGTGVLIDGRVALDLAAMGTRERAPLTGSVSAERLRLDAPQYGLHWTDGRLAARLADDKVTLDEFTLTAGDGRFTASGTLPALNAAATDGARALEVGTRIVWRAERFRAANRPDMRFVVSGRGTLGVDNGRLALDGALKVDEGHYEFAETRGATLAADVVVKGRPVAAAPAPRFARVPLAVGLDLDLGDALTVTGDGLDTGLAGRVRIAAAAGGALTAKGTINTINGRYFAFGQRLIIDRGQLIFDGPLDNPALDIVALRKNLAVEAGVEVTGTVKVPQVRLTSDPPVPDGEKLSWLVLGQGLDRTSGADAAALQAAAATLFGRGKMPIGTTLAQTIGLDDISVRSTSTLPGGTETGGVGGQVVAVGKRLSDKLYLVYEQGLTVATNALKLEYALTRNITLRAEAGVVSGFGIYYRRSFE